MTHPDAGYRCPKSRMNRRSSHLSVVRQAHHERAGLLAFLSANGIERGIRIRAAA